MLGVGGEAHVAVGEDADQLALLAGLDHRNAGDVVLVHQAQRVGQRRRRANRVRVDHHAGHVALHHRHLLGLRLRRQVAMDDADAAGLRHGDGQPAFGDRVHGRGQDRDLDRYFAGHARADVGLAGQHVGGAGLQQHVVERQRHGAFIQGGRCTIRVLLSLQVGRLRAHRGPCPGTRPSAAMYGIAPRPLIAPPENQGKAVFAGIVSIPIFRL